MSETEVKSFLQAHKTDFLTVESDEALLKVVQSRPGAVVLVDVYSITSRVNVTKAREQGIEKLAREGEAPGISQNRNHIGNIFVTAVTCPAECAILSWLHQTTGLASGLPPRPGFRCKARF